MVFGVPHIQVGEQFFRMTSNQHQWMASAHRPHPSRPSAIGPLGGCLHGLLPRQYTSIPRSLLRQFAPLPLMDTWEAFCQYAHSTSNKPFQCSRPADHSIDALNWLSTQASQVHSVCGTTPLQSACQPFFSALNMLSIYPLVVYTPRKLSGEIVTGRVRPKMSPPKFSGLFVGPKFPCASA